MILLQNAHRSSRYLNNRTAVDCIVQNFTRNHIVTLKGLSSSKNSSNNEHEYIKLPEPTWSIKELNLSKENHELHKDKKQSFTYNLENLASKSCIDLNKMSSERRDEIVHDLNDIMNCLSMVTTFKNEESENLTDEEIYDMPRGLTQAPVFDQDEDTELIDDRVGECDDVIASVGHKMKINKDTNMKFFHV